jgi:hypothetical protein
MTGKTTDPVRSEEPCFEANGWQKKGPVRLEEPLF